MADGKSKPNTSSRRALWLPVYIPTLLLALNEGILVPVLPLYALTFDVSFGVAALVVAAAGIGTALSDVPAGAFLNRLGMKNTMLVGALLAVVGTLALVFAQSVPELVLYRFIAGIGMAMWSLSRHAFVTDAIDPRERGRAISTFGGIHRIGMFGGPAIGGVVGQLLGFEASFLVAAGLAAAGLAIAAYFVVDTRMVARTTRQGRWSIVWKQVRERRGDLIAASLAQVCGQVIRTGRLAIIPFYGEAVLGLNVAQIGTIQSASSIVDMALFVPAGYIMDRWGRKYAAVPSFALMGIGMALIPLSTGFWSLFAVVTLIGVGNGLGSGVIMTLGADLAPAGATGEFLGLWRFVGDSGRASGPVVVGGLTDSSGFTVASLVLGGIGLVSALVLIFLVKETRAGPTATG